MSARKTLSPDQRRALLATPAGWLACGFGSGLTPKAQGTFGSLAALLPWLLLRHLSLPLYVLVLLLGFGVGVWASNVASRALGVADHRSIVWDEFIGQWIALIPLLLPAFQPSFQSTSLTTWSPATWWSVAAGFVLFRLFDVWKPWPISWLDRRVKGGLGVMIDDVIAGIFAAVVLGIALHFLG
ncbi:phosphatidylglycerophosphatase A [Rhodanobacter sp. 115]|jgi:phosphatidylglycerophosphatase A|uniref:phosphatidylglycerophosphatase A family protein n=1 Tax=Rhodanobacter sp. FW021-MT20 TaxID=1162282 RepID=UPI000260EC86|nr:phosphatidylglycerophosphatase A [Rhodanobacter sp. 115]EIL90580.1 phosphatidylglycerophosphatase A [Rhodanobacter sp. 115]